MSLAEHKIDSLVKQKRFWAAALHTIKSKNDRLLITILIGNNLVNVYTAALATTLAISFGEQMWFAQSQAVWIATWLVTFFLLLFGEIIPKSFATKNAATISLFVAPVYKILMIVLHPVIIFIELLIRMFTKEGEVEKMSDEEIESFIDMWKNTGWLEHHEHEKIKNILDFDNIEVEEIMTPRVKIEAISMDMTVQEAMNFYLAHTHSRIPVYSDTIDKIDHFVTSRDLVFAFKHGELDKKISELKLKTVLKIPLNQPINKVLETFQNAHKIMGIVLDEYGGVAGLVTMEDIIEEVFGDIRDETDKEVEEIQDIWSGKFIIESSVLIEEILSESDLNLADIGHELERFPKSGEALEFEVLESELYQKISFRVLTIADGKMGKIEVVLVKK